MIWFKFYTAWREYIRELSDAEAGRFLKALLDFEETGETQSLSGTERIMYNIASKQLKQDAEHSAEVSKKRSEAGRGSRKNQMITNDNKYYQMLPNADNSENIEQLQTNDRQIKELRVKNTEVKEVKNDICAEAHVSAPEKPKLTPDDHDFWKFAKENAELAEAFYKASGLYPIGNQFGRWVNDLRNFREAGITIQQMQAAVQKIRREGRITISAPGSVFTTARDISLGGSSGRIVNQPKPQNKTAYEMLEEMGIV